MRYVAFLCRYLTNLLSCSVEPPFLQLIQDDLGSSGTHMQDPGQQPSERHCSGKKLVWIENQYQMKPVALHQEENTIQKSDQEDWSRDAE